jgi:hypothetical protein
MRALRTVGIAAVALASFGLVGCTDDDEGGSSGETVRAEDFGDDWPLTVSEGRLLCEPADAVVFVAPNGTRYAVNSMATTHRRGIDIDPIWRDNPSPTRGPKVNIGPLIDRGLELC